MEKRDLSAEASIRRRRIIDRLYATYAGAEAARIVEAKKSAAAQAAETQEEDKVIATDSEEEDCFTIPHKRPRLIGPSLPPSSPPAPLPPRAPGESLAKTRVLRRRLTEIGPGSDGKAPDGSPAAPKASNAASGGKAKSLDGSSTADKRRTGKGKKKADEDNEPAPAMKRRRIIVFEGDDDEGIEFYADLPRYPKNRGIPINVVVNDSENEYYASLPSYPKAPSNSVDTAASSDSVPANSINDDAAAAASDSINAAGLSPSVSDTVNVTGPTPPAFNAVNAMAPSSTASNVIALARSGPSNFTSIHTNADAGPSNLTARPASSAVAAPSYDTLDADEEVYWADDDQDSAYLEAIYLSLCEDIDDAPLSD